MTMSPHATDTARAGRPRSARAHEAILDAILELVAEGMSVDALSIEAVAARAGVGKATIYRRWPNKQAMLSEAVQELKGPAPQPVGDGVRDRLISLVSKIAAGDHRAARIFPCMLPEGDQFVSDETGRQQQQRHRARHHDDERQLPL